MAPIKRSAYLQPLSREHHYSLLFCWKLRRGIKNGIKIHRIIDYIKYFELNMLIPHFKEEETALFIYSDGAHVQQALAEHRQILSIIDSMKIDPSNTGYVAIESLADLVDQHVRFEERQLFPYLEQSLTLAQLEAVASAIKEGPAVGDDFEDYFWELENSPK